jgi:hypothetical protein
MDETWKDEFIRLFDDSVKNINELKEICRNNKVTKIYKYRKVDEFDIINLENNRLKMTCPIEFNDPFDCVAAALNRDSFIEDFGLKEYENYIDNEYKNDLCIKIHNEFYPRHEEHIKSIQICCFSTNKDSILMWSHYANMHSGFCIEYDMDMLLDSRMPIRPVKYVNDMPIIYNRVNMKKAVYDVILCKSKEWSYESEWRVIYNKDDKRQFLRTINPSAIYIGCKATTDLKDKILKICKTKSIDCYVAEKDFFSYKLNFIKIN